MFTLSHPATFCQELFSSFFFAFFILHFPYPARTVQCFQFCISCLSDEDYLIISFLNCQRFSCFLFISHNSDNSLCLLILYTKYLFFYFHVHQTYYYPKKLLLFTIFKSNVRETWRVILVSKADIFLSESLRILAERLSQSEIGLPLRQICYYSPPKEVGVFSTEIKNLSLSDYTCLIYYRQRKAFLL